MPAPDLAGRRVAIWGLGREGRAAIAFLRQRYPALPLLLFDDDGAAQPPPGLEGVACAFGPAPIAATLAQLPPGGVDVLVKSPGVSLYRDEIRQAREKGIAITSLLNLWFAEPHPVTTICVTGTKGKSTTASLIALILRNLGHETALVGNIGVPISEIADVADFAVIEISSYQAADFAGTCDIAVLTSLFPEHLDWHRSVEAYYRDKINLLRHARRRITGVAAASIVERLDGEIGRDIIGFDNDAGIHPRGAAIFDRARCLGAVSNPYLARPHNRSDLCAALTVAKSLDIDPAAALAAVAGFAGLPHRQQELGNVGGVLYVDDSISTIPESTIAALEVYHGRDITLIVGGYDRGIDYGKLVDALSNGGAKRAVCLGASGERICAALNAAAGGCSVHLARSMAEAVACAVATTPPGGVVLLSPAAPSYGLYRDFSERGRDFAAAAGLAAAAEAGR
jgi:UDP-N-acetylmuramoyl-L-alanine---L-glutamate ligase